MKKVSKQQLAMETTKGKPGMTMGLDLGDRYSHYCLLNEECEVVEEGRIQSTETAFRRQDKSNCKAKTPMIEKTKTP